MGLIVGTRIVIKCRWQKKCDGVSYVDEFSVSFGQFEIAVRQFIGTAN